jgi:outer membrane protein assembly factor BamA
VWGRWLVVLGIASACGGGQLRAPKVAPREDTLRAIRIEGNHAIETSALEPALALHEVVQVGGVIDPYLLAADTERIRAAYLRRGFFEVKLTSRVEHREDHTQAVVFTITEGRRAVTRVEITGLPPEVSPASARAQVALHDGAPFDYDTYEAAKQPLVTLVANAGYAHAEVKGTVTADPVAATATVRYEIEPGERCRFGAITIPRAELLPESLTAAVRARLRFATGDWYSASALEASQAELYDLGRFSMVQVRPDQPDRNTTEVAASRVVNVAVELVLANRHEVHAGFGIGYEPQTYEARVRGGGSLVPEAFPLLTLASDARVAVTIPHGLDRDQLEPKIRALVSLQYLDLFWPRLRGDVEAGADYQTVEAYTWTGEHVRLGLGSPLGPRWLQLRVGWVLEHLTFSKLDPAIDPETATDPNKAHELGLDRAQLRGAYQAALVADLRDNPVEPHRGAYVDLRVTQGTRLAGGDLSYLQLTPELRGYLSLDGTVIAARVRVGAIFGDVPVTERYYSGGTSGHRGFSDRHLSPMVSATVDGKLDTQPIGGAGLLETGVELRRPLGTLWALPVGTNVFLDGGDVTDSARQLDPSRMYWAIGTGIWSKLVGDLKIRIDLGYRLNDKGPDDPLPTTGWYDNLAFHLGVGEVY